MFRPAFHLILASLAATPALAEPIRHCAGHDAAVHAVAFRPDGRVIGTGSADRTVKLWDSASGALRETLHGHQTAVTAVAFSADGNTLVSADRDGRLLLWRAEGDAHRARKLAGHPLCIHAVVFLPDGETFLTCSQDRRVKVWDARTGEMVRSFGAAEAGLLSLAAAAKGGRFAVGAQDGSVLTGQVAGGALRVIERLPGPVSALAFSPDGKQLFAGAADGEIHCWDCETQEKAPPFLGHRDAVCALWLQGRRMISLGASGQLVLWDAVAGRPVYSHRFPAPSFGVAIDATNASLAVAAGDRTFFLVEVPQQVR